MRTFCSMSAALLVSALASSVRADEAHALVERAIQAAGGAANLERAGATLTHTIGTLGTAGGSVSFTQEIRFERPNRYRQVVSLKQGDGKQVELITVYDGRKGWLKHEGRVDDLDERQLEETRETVYLAQLLRLICLREPAFELKILGESKVAERPVVGLRVSARGYRDVELYFDKESSLLLKTRRRAAWRDKEFTEERLLSDYREVEGIKSAKKIEINRDGDRFMSVDILDVRYLAAFGDNTFERP